MPANAAWCSLCFADLRQPVAAPVREPAAVAAASMQPQATVEAVAIAPVSQAPVFQTGPAPVPALDAPVANQSETPAIPSPTWPCPRCGAKVPIELDSCHDCGAGFLAGVANTVSIRLPVVGDVKSMSSSQRLMMAVTIAIGLMAFIVALAFIGGHLFN